jgi:hypothetical protein
MSRCPDCGNEGELVNNGPIPLGGQRIALDVGGDRPVYRRISYTAQVRECPADGVYFPVSTYVDEVDIDWMDQR